MRKSVLATIEAVRPFIPRSQYLVMKSALRGEERGFFREAFRDLEKTIDSMPVTYGQDGKGEEAVIYLHYFYGGADWWITEKDIEGGIDQAFGLVDLGHGPELGYISIRELVGMAGVNVDLHWEPKTIGQVMAKNHPDSDGPKKAPAPVKAPPAYTVAQVVNVGDWFEGVAPGLLN